MEFYTTWESQGGEIEKAHTLLRSSRFRILQENNSISIKESNYKALEKKELVKNKKEIDENIMKNEFNIVDARSKERCCLYFQDLS